jgi:predicted enzyme related to lactoylglutathione lyase
METTVSARGRFLWYDLNTSDPSAAHDFYRSVIGWTTQVFEGSGETPYTMWVADGVPIGGSMDTANLPGNPPPHWLVFIGTDDLDQTLRDVAAHGGTALMEPMQAPEVGRWAACRDPQGAVFMAYEPDVAPEPSAPANGHVSWNELMTPDPAGSLAFYRDVFGWTAGDALDMGPENGVYQLFCVGPEPAGGIYAIGDEPWPPAWTPYVKVTDIEGAVERVREGGGTVVVGPMTVPTGDCVAVCTDAQGAAFGLHEDAA